MVEIITKEWEITKSYIFEAAMKNGPISLNWEDFERLAQDSKPTVAVKVDEPLRISEMTVKAFEEVKKNIKGSLSGVILAISYNNEQDMQLEELNGMHEVFSTHLDENVQLCWGIQEAYQITNARSVTVFAFEKL